ncbi:MAG: hypothetical protein JNJ89_15105 [Rubrivivax sp.]|nr:hypothetical protein [Rubrivivax sp.]
MNAIQLPYPSRRACPSSSSLRAGRLSETAYLARLVATAVAALVCTMQPASAQVMLQPSLTAPAELQIGAHDLYRLSLRNAGSTSAVNAVMRLPLASGQQPMLPLPTGCVKVTEAFGNQASVPQVRCTASSVPARATRSWSFVMQAPALPATVVHQARASANGVASGLSNAVTTTYAAFSIPVLPGTQWEMASCYNGPAGPLAWNLCSPTAEAAGAVTLAVGGVIDTVEGPIGSWLQTDPQSLRVESSPAYTGTDPIVINYTVISSRCLRGGGVSVPPPGGTTIYTASRICRL